MKEITTNMDINEILSEFTSRLPKPEFELQRRMMVSTSLIISFPECTQRTSKVHDGLLSISCGIRNLVDLDDVDDLGFSQVLKECSQCKGFKGAMVKKIEYAFIKVV